MSQEDFRGAIDYWLTLTGSSQNYIEKTNGFPHSAIVHLMSGRHKPSEKYAERVATALHVPPEERAAFMLLAKGQSIKRVEKLTGNKLLYLARNRG